MKSLPIPVLLAVLGLAVPVAADTSAQAGAALFAAHCAACHGADARGSGPEAEGPGRMPPDLTRIADRRDGVWPMLEIMSIVDGYARRVTLRPRMPVIPELTEGPVVDFDTGNGLTRQAPARLVALVTYLESIQSPRPQRYGP